MFFYRVRLSRYALQPVLCAVYGADERVAGVGIELCVGNVFAGVGLIQTALVCTNLTHALGIVHLCHGIAGRWRAVLVDAFASATRVCAIGNRAVGHVGSLLRSR